MENTKHKRTLTDEQRTARNAYQRRYRAEHPTACRRWRDAYILRRAARLQEAEGEAVTDRGGH